MEHDFYNILNVSRSASCDDIRVAYRRQAKLWHPDRNQSPEATARFQLIGEAYATLSDPVRRKQYNAYGPTQLLPRASPMTRGGVPAASVNSVMDYLRRSPDLFRWAHSSDRSAAGNFAAGTAQSLGGVLAGMGLITVGAGGSLVAATAGAGVAAGMAVGSFTLCMVGSEIGFMLIQSSVLTGAAIAFPSFFIAPLVTNVLLGSAVAVCGSGAGALVVLASAFAAAEIDLCAMRTLMHSLALSWSVLKESCVLGGKLMYAGVEAGALTTAYSASALGSVAYQGGALAYEKAKRAIEATVYYSALPVKYMYTSTPEHLAASVAGELLGGKKYRHEALDVEHSVDSSLGEGWTVFAEEREEEGGGEVASRKPKWKGKEKQGWRASTTDNLSCSEEGWERL
mgnify:CR=1 FL=1